jgi:hypothetical protein
MLCIVGLHEAQKAVSGETPASHDAQLGASLPATSPRT